MPERLHKYLAHCGIASRRKAEEFILEGRVEVNGQTVTELGVQVDPERDSIRFDGKPVRTEKKVYYLLHKPRGVTTTSEDEHGRKTVLDLLGNDVTARVYPVGRLDRDSEGLLVLTNDGDLAWYLTHPSCGVRKTYHVVVEGIITDAMIAEILDKGVRLGPDLIKPVALKLLRRYRNSTSLHITVAEGVNREIRRVFAMLGHEVMKLLRLEIGPLKIQKLPRGEYRPLTRRELSTLFHGMERLGEAMENPETEGRHRRKPHIKKRQRTGKPDPAAHAPAARKGGKPGKRVASGRSGKPGSRPGSAPKGKYPARTDAPRAPSSKSHGADRQAVPARDSAKPVHPIHGGHPLASSGGRSASTPAPGRHASSSSSRPATHASKKGSVASAPADTAKGFKASHAPKSTKAPYPAKGSKSSAAKGGKSSYASKGSKPSYASKNAGSSSTHKGSNAPYPGKGSKSSTVDKGGKSTYASKGPKPSHASKNAGSSFSQKGSKTPYPGKGSKPTHAGKGSKTSSPAWSSKPSHPAKGAKASHAGKPSHAGNSSHAGKPSRNAHAGKNAMGGNKSKPSNTGRKPSAPRSSASSKPTKGRKR